jgi:hypothetical protein
MKLLRYTLAAALAVAMSGGNGVWAMEASSSSSTSSVSSSSSSASISSANSKEAKSANANDEKGEASSSLSSSSSSSGAAATAAARLEGFREAYAIVSGQRSGQSTSSGLSGRYQTAESAENMRLRMQIALLEKQAAMQNSAADVKHEQKAAPDVVLDHVETNWARLKTGWGCAAASSSAVFTLVFCTILSCLISSDSGYLAHCPHAGYRLIGPTELFVAGALTWVFWKMAGRAVACQKAEAQKEAKPDHHS